MQKLSSNFIYEIQKASVHITVSVHKWLKFLQYHCPVHCTHFMIYRFYLHCTMYALFCTIKNIITTDMHSLIVQEIGA